MILLLRARRRCARGGAVGLAVAALAACQPIDVGGRAQGSPTPTAPAATRLGAPERAVAMALPDLLDRGELAAAEWEAGAVLAEVGIDLSAGGAPAAAQLTYVAPDADRFLIVELTPDGVGTERPTLDALALSAIDADGVAAIPPLPDVTIDGVLEAAAPALAACDLGAASTILLASGAPYGWDGDGWASAPAWQVSVLAEDGGVVVDPATGATTEDACFTAAG